MPTLGYDARGNLTTSGANVYSYTSENLLKTATNSVTLSYDPALRLYETVGAGATTRFGYDGAYLIAEYDGGNNLLRRYVHGPGSDTPLVWYEGTGLADRRWYHADERGSIIGISSSGGAAMTILAYDEYGIPASTNAGRFQYTGQTWLPEVGLYYYKARMYSPTLGRFMQTDPIGYGDGINWYAYVGGDPVNGRDPSGLKVMCTGSIILVNSCSGSTVGGSRLITVGGSSEGQSRDYDSYDSIASALPAGTSPALIRQTLAFIRQSGGFGNVVAQGNGFGDIVVTASFSRKNRNTDYGLDRAPLSPTFFATPDWWDRLEAAGYSDNVEHIVAAVDAGILHGRTAEYAHDAGLPGNRKTLYYRYEVPNLPNRFPNLFSGPRVYVGPGNEIYFAPYHGDPGPGVSTGFILIQLQYERK